ncbi:hypothetical protein NNQ27_10025 [Cronobacter dublinensis subsp. infanticibi]|uniref:Phage protein n=1 Tax=Cronobacter malonaticus TaxID=413503 RepID=A0ABX5K3E2_9ENTR|nr:MULTISPECIES: hypothetical protein [Cronobacter]EMA4770081.1 hypothetical protein [Cronobacter sakazakii]PUX08198.1 hypothetical protein AUN13_15830 [Cronobacter malonaticus]PUX09634.1 hypothetical protein AUM46_04250 [Cronobacter malonaticus]WEP47204.1 hypothetical protein NNQ27_10025 [Cronobacter dublinensis]
MDKSREQFLEWFSKEYEEVNNSTELSAQVIKMIASAAWQASRAAVEIELDEKVMVEDEFDKGHNCAIDYCAESIRAAGLKVKGE